jgi:hypothetical protein
VTILYALIYSALATIEVAVFAKSKHWTRWVCFGAAIYCVLMGMAKILSVQS